MSSRITSIASVRMHGASCSKFTTTVLVAVGMLTELPQPAHPLQSVGGILEIVVVQIGDRMANANSLLHAPHAVGIETQRRFGECRAERAKNFDVVVGREEPAFQLVRLEAVAGDQVFGVRDHVVGSDFAGRAVLRRRYR